MPPQGPPAGVGKTALGAAMIRARESRRDDRLFDDAYAQAFVDAAPGAFPEAQKAEEQRAAPGGQGVPAVSGTPAVSGVPGPGASVGAVLYAHGVLRTRFFDDYLASAATAGCRQVVLLAAGLDTRAFRLAWPSHTRVFELDLPDVLVFKDTVLAARKAVPGCERITVPADLRQDWRDGLASAGFDPTDPAAWLAEGLLLYLTADEARQLLTRVTELSAPGSRLSFEHSPTAAAALTSQARHMPGLQPYAALWKGGLGDDAPRWLASHGWQPEFHEFGALSDFYRRPVPRPAHGGILTAARQGR